MEINNELICHLASIFYNVTPKNPIVQLDGYDDKNFLITNIADNRKYVLKACVDILYTNEERTGEQYNICAIINQLAFFFYKTNFSSTQTKRLDLYNDQHNG